MANPPPREIDGARVIAWAWSGSTPFGVVPGADPSEIFGLAITTYDNRDFYRFSCDKEWNMARPIKNVPDACWQSLQGP
jgi:hypothetical protein